MKKKLLLLLTAMLLVGVSAKATNFISDLMVSTHDKEATAKSQLTTCGYTVIDQDLNQGGGGHYVYLGYKTSTNLADAITGLYVVSGSSWAGTEGKTFTNNGCTFQAISYTPDSKGGNLNRGRGSSAYDLYLYYTKDGNTTNSIYSAYKPITSLTVVSSTSSQSEDTYVQYYNLTGYGYANTNQGGSASNYIYLNVTSTHICSLDYAPTSAGSGTHKNYCTVCAYTRSTGSCNYGDWTSYNGTQCYHQCSVCNDKVYANHTLSGTYYYYNATQCYTVCTKCSYKKYGSHNWGGWYQNNQSSHKHICGYCNYTGYESHSWTYTYSPNTPSYHTKKCSVSTCGYSMVENHTKVTDAAAVAATCTTAGSTIAEHCSLCTYSVAATTISALGHQYGDYGVCTRTPGEKHYSHAQGDVTCDGELSGDDIATLVHVVLNKLWANADYNNDGVLDLTDITALVNDLLSR